MKRFLFAIALLGLASCGGREEQTIRLRLEEAAHCERTEDCTLIQSKCPFDCYAAVNAGEVVNITRLLDRFESNCTYSCTPPPPVACIAGQCQMHREDCTSLAQTFDALAGDESFCKGIDAQNLATIAPVMVGGTLVDVAKTPVASMDAFPWRSTSGKPVFEYRLTIQGQDQGREIVTYATADIELTQGNFYRIDYLNTCKHMLLQATSAVPSPILDSFTLPEEMTCGE